MGTFKKVTCTIAYLAIVTVFSTTALRAQVGSGQPGVAALLSAINSADAEVKALNAQKSISPHDLHLVPISKIENDGNKATIDRAIAKNAGPLGEMREHIGRNDVIAKTLAAAGVSLSQVVAIDVNPGAEIYVFYQ